MPETGQSPGHGSSLRAEQPDREGSRTGCPQRSTWRSVDREMLLVLGGVGALGHPRVWLEIDPKTGFVECGYCDRKYVLKPGSRAGHH